MRQERPAFKLGRLDHVHFRVPDRAEAARTHPMVPQQTGIAFSVDAGTFIAFARSLPRQIESPNGEPLGLADLIDRVAAKLDSLYPGTRPPWRRGRRT